MMILPEIFSIVLCRYVILYLSDLMTMTGQPGKPVYCKTIEDYILDTNKKMDSIDLIEVSSQE